MWQLKQGMTVAAVVSGIVALTATACGNKDEETQVSSEQTEPSTVVSTASRVTTEVVGGESTVSSPVSFQDAETAYNNKRYDEAVSLFTGYTAQKPENPWGHYMLGLSSWKTRDFDRAETELLRVIELDPTHLKSRLNLSRVYLDKGEYQKALEQVDSVLVVDSGSAEGFRLLGRVSEEMGQLMEAEQAYRQALKLDGQDAWSMNNLGLNFINQKRPEEALGVLARAIQIKSDNAQFHNNLGMALELNGYFVKATEVYQKAVEIDGSYQKAIDNLARVTGHEDKPGVTTIDLEVLAQNFATEVEGSTVSQN